MEARPLRFAKSAAVDCSDGHPTPLCIDSFKGEEEGYSLKVFK